MEGGSHDSQGSSGVRVKTTDKHKFLSSAVQDEIDDAMQNVGGTIELFECGAQIRHILKTVGRPFGEAPSDDAVESRRALERRRFAV